VILDYDSSLECNVLWLLDSHGGGVEMVVDGGEDAVNRPV